MHDGIVLINNDKYGAPELKKNSQGFTLKGLIVAVTIHVALIAAYMLFAYINESKAKDIPVNHREPLIIVDLDEPPPVDNEEIPPIKKEEIIEKVKDLSSLEPKPVAKEIADDVKLKTQEELNNIDGNTSREGDSLVASRKTDITDNTKIDDKIKKDIKEPPLDIYNVSNVDVVPVCTNLQQVRAQMKYPELAVEIQQEGRVTVKVLVGTDGRVLKIGSISGPDVFYDEVKDKAMELQFTPGLQSNSPVKVWVSVPFQFKLK